MSNEKQPTSFDIRGQLDGLTLSPIVDDAGKLMCIDATCDRLPGLRLTVQAGAAEELWTALGALLGKDSLLPR
jgi:hypothetical protein